MALADIIARLEADANAEVAAISSAGEQRVNEARAAARQKADAIVADARAAAESAAAREAATIVVNARLRSRDEAVSARRALVDEALAEAAQALAELPNERYAQLIARKIAASARGSEEILFGALDAQRADAIMAAVRAVAPTFELRTSDTPAPFDRGVLLSGDRTRVDLSLQSIVDERRDELEVAVADVLFGEGA